MNLVYCTSPLEEWVKNFYTRNHILKPKDLKPKRIARKLEIYVKLWPLPSRYDVNGRFRCICIDNRLPLFEKRECFYHELGHILLHGGNQTMMPAALRELQEWGANNFMLYASIPYHMLGYINLNQENDKIIFDMSEMFGVTPGLCRMRLERIRCKLVERSYDNHERFV